jgi:hypothetical protein
MLFSLRAAARHGAGGGAEQLEWMPYDMPYTLNSGVRAARLRQARWSGGQHASVTSSKPSTPSRLHKGQRTPNTV